MSGWESDSRSDESASAFSRVPTLARAIEDGLQDETTTIVSPNIGSYWIAWLLSWFGIALSGGAFGFAVVVFISLFESNAGEILLLGLVVGTLIASFIGAPVVATICTLAWVVGLTQFRRGAPLLAGALTGMVSTAGGLLRPQQANWAQLIILVAGAFGALGGYLPARWYWKNREVATLDAADHRWQFSLRDLFLRFTVATILLACWTFAVRWLLNQ